MKTFILKTDGGAKTVLSNGAVGVIAYVAYVIYESVSGPEAESIIKHVASYSRPSVTSSTSNEAEYMGLASGLAAISDIVRPEDRVIINSDSKLIVKQVLGEWKVKMASLADRRKAAATSFEKLKATLNNKVDLYHVPREDNKVADKLCQFAKIGIYKVDATQSLEDFFKEAKQEKKIKDEANKSE